MSQSNSDDSQVQEFSVAAQNFHMESFNYFFQKLDVF